MRQGGHRFRLASVALLSVLVAESCARASDRSATTPAPNRREPQRVEALAARARATDAEIVFLGDSITAHWEEAGREVWQRHYGHRRALNLGVGWEQTENVLWRIERGDLDPLRPKLIVLLIGTNNSEHGGDGPREIADGVGAIVDRLRERFPRTKILLLGIFPRGAEPGDPLRANNDAANQRISELADPDGVHYRDIGSVFLRENGSIDRDIMPDALHLSPRGYALWAEAIEADVERLLAAPQRSP